MENLPVPEPEYNILNKLSRRERVFVYEYVLSNSLYKSAIKAGYSEKSAYRVGLNLLRKEVIRKAIDVVRHEISLQYEIKKEYFIKHLKDIIENRISKNSDRIAALTLLARITGHIKESSSEPQQIVILKQEGLTEKPIEVENIEDF